MADNRLAALKSSVIKANTMMNQLGCGNSWWFNQTTNPLYEALGYPDTIDYCDYVNRYKRQEIANRIVNAPVQGTWSHDPKIYEADNKNQDTDTAFETTFEKISVDVKLFYHLYKLDLLATLGRYSVLFLGLNDNTDPALPATKATGISFVSPIPENRAIIQTWEDDISSPRYGLPLTYSITATSGENVSIGSSGDATVARTVHWSRTVHIAENSLDSEVYGIPYMMPVYNRLL
ncbi:MAG: hypothetical protein KAS32_22765, partial [Candidatus Peribacteraceae bacterium]|nr:hypothetical protein [Candidatus Peribacteraceae bacterium]